MKILHLISEEPPIYSGFSRCVDHLSSELSKRGHEVKVMSTKHIRHWEVGEIKLVHDLAKIYTLNIKDYDIINLHGHTPTFSDNLLIATKMRARGKPIVYTLHCLANFYLRPISKVYNWVMNKLVGLSDSIIVTSPSYAEYVRYTKKVHVIPWGVNYEFFHQPRKEYSGYNILFVGQMRPYKGLSILLRAVKNLNGRLHVIGGGPDHGKYVEQAKKLQLSNIRFYGNPQDMELRDIYLQSDVLVLPSISTNEAFGLVTLEAAAAGCVVVASNLPGVRDIVKQFGILISPGNMEALQRALLHLSKRENRIEYIQRGYEAAKKYPWSKTGREYEKVYKEAIN